MDIIVCRVGNDGMLSDRLGKFNLMQPEKLVRDHHVVMQIY
jgi:hypothetical protein